jgi:hypothetical protein
MADPAKVFNAALSLDVRDRAALAERLPRSEQYLIVTVYKVS